jgi:hypothetical protein
MADRIGIEPTLRLIAPLPLAAALCALPLRAGVPLEAAGHASDGRPSSLGV